MSTRHLALPTTGIVGLALLVGVSSAPAAGGDPSPPVPREALQGVNFVNTCAFSHRAPDDPIVTPGLTGASHDHSFVGARTTSAFSTTETLLASATSCERPGHTAAYWMPSLIVDGAVVPPRGATIYYRRSTVGRVTAFPPGFRVIAGNAKATTAQDTRVTFWNCGQAAGGRLSTTVPVCPRGRMSALRLHVVFPSCWDCVSLDAVDHRSHMAYPRRGRCPSTHPVATPVIAFVYRYPEIRGATVALASGGQSSAHADFLNAWNQSTLEGLVNGCLNALRHCRRGE